ncbi:sulfatase-like hydrolase/transferase [uncultured Sphaerochaeta sp.]|uniref:sulfatase family protein n=1 Tax=uncultured Sphaerochaeta sp. TaxID=886478 RepID=UPI002A0A8885|nr:sulfatase-like hydrolase/transferase [uncultured Sphaerochaeta sp.]
MNKPKNILFIMTDQMRADALSLGTCCSKETPNLDALCKEGTRFTNCCTVSPICAPARAALLSGLYPHQMGVWDNSPHTFPPEAKNWVRFLKKKGYKTSVFGKTHYYPYNGSVPDMREAEPLIQAYGYETVNEIPGPRVSAILDSHMAALWEEQGFREKVKEDLAARYKGNQALAYPSVLPLDLYPDVYVGKTAGEYLQKYDNKEPFFCFVSFGGPHDPWDCPLPYVQRFESIDMPESLPPFIDRYPDRPKGGWDTAPAYPPFSKEDVQNIRRNYAGKVTLIDEQIGHLCTILKQKNLWEDTLIIFTSDHGEMNGDKQRLYKENFFESALKIPLIIRIPGQIAQTSSSLVGLQDIGPTIVELAGETLDYPQQGISLVPVLNGCQITHRNLVFSEYNQEIMVFDGNWKLVVNKDLKPYLLFNLAEDPLEHINLAGGNLPEEKRLLQQIRTFLIDTQEGFYTREDANHEK